MLCLQYSYSSRVCLQLKDRVCSREALYMQRKIVSIAPTNEITSSHAWACLIETASSVLCSIWDTFTVYDITYGTNCTVILFDLCVEQGNDFTLIVSPLQRYPTETTFRFTCKKCFRSTYLVFQIKNLCQHVKSRNGNEI